MATRGTSLHPLGANGVELDACLRGCPTEDRRSEIDPAPLHSHPVDMKRLAFALKSATVRRSAGASFAELCRNQWLTTSEVSALQRQRFAELVGFAMRESPFYRDFYRDFGLSETDLSDPLLAQRVPTIDRSVLRDNASRIVPLGTDPRIMRDARTGGSTGQPLRTKQDARVKSLALAWRMYTWWGVEPYENLGRIGRWSFGVKQEVVNALQWWPSRHAYLDAGYIDTAGMSAFSDRLDRIKPALLEGYVGALLEFADYVERSGRRFPSIRAIGTTAAPLTASARQRISDVLKAPVYDEYRGSEVNWMAGECERAEGLHVFADQRQIDIVDDDDTAVPEGQPGSFAVTDLANRVFPIIRYRNGDKGSSVAGDCACGMGLPRIAPPDGRVTDLLRLPSGAVLGHRLMGMFSGEPEAVKLFQLHQHVDFSITVRVVLGPDPDAIRKVESVANTLRDRIHHEVPVTVEVVDSLPYTGGKTKYVICDVPTSG